MALGEPGVGGADGDASCALAVLDARYAEVDVGGERREARGYAACDRGVQSSDAKGLIDELDAEIEWTDALFQMLLGGEAQTYHGRDAVRELMREQDDLFSEFSAEYSEVRERGDKMVAVGVSRTRGRAVGPQSKRPSPP